MATRADRINSEIVQVELQRARVAALYEADLRRLDALLINLRRDHAKACLRAEYEAERGSVAAGDDDQRGQPQSSSVPHESGNPPVPNRGRLAADHGADIWLKGEGPQPHSSCVRVFVLRAHEVYAKKHHGTNRTNMKKCTRIRACLWREVRTPFVFLRVGRSRAALSSEAMSVSQI